MNSSILLSSSSITFANNMKVLTCGLKLLMAKRANSMSVSGFRCALRTSKNGSETGNMTRRTQVKSLMRMASLSLFIMALLQAGSMLSILRETACQKIQAHGSLPIKMSLLYTMARVLLLLKSMPSL